LSAFHPSATVERDRLCLLLLENRPVRSLKLDCVVDLTYLGQVVGIEVLDFQRQLGEGVTVPRADFGPLKWSYDNEMDALYIRIGQDRGQIQESANATVGLDLTQHVVRLEIPVPRVG
jgi:uncharacterized protein YuzE